MRASTAASWLARGFLTISENDRVGTNNHRRMTLKKRAKRFDPPESITGADFRAIRENVLELKRVELAELIGITAHSLWRYESGVRPVPRLLAMNIRLLGAIKGTYIGQQFGL